MSIVVKWSWKNIVLNHLILKRNGTDKLKHDIVIDKNKFYATFRFYDTTEKEIRSAVFQSLYGQFVDIGLNFKCWGNNYKIIFSKDLRTKQ